MYIRIDSWGHFKLLSFSSLQYRALKYKSTIQLNKYSFDSLQDCGYIYRSHNKWRFIFLFVYKPYQHNLSRHFKLLDFGSLQYSALKNIKIDNSIQIIQFLEVCNTAVIFTIRTIDSVSYVAAYNNFSLDQQRAFFSNDDKRWW